MKRLIVLIALVSALAASGAARAVAQVNPAFSANNLLVLFQDGLGGDALKGFTPAFAAVPGGFNVDIAGGTSPCFLPLPDGHLLVCGGDAIREYDPDGTLVRTLDIPDCTGMALGPNGLLYVTTGQDIVAVDLESEEIVRALDVADGTNPCFTPAGDLMLLRATGQDVLVPVPDPVTGEIGFELVPEIEVLVLDPADGVVLDQAVIPAATGMTVDPVGRVYVATSIGGLVVLDGGLERLDVIALAQAGVGPCFLPNGNLGVLFRDAGRFAEIDPATGVEVASFAVPGAASVGVMPHLFAVTLKGKLNGDAKIKESGMLLLRPGSGQMVLALSDLPQDELAGLIGAPALLLPGFEGTEDPLAAKRAFAGLQVTRAAGRTTLGALDLVAKGFAGTADYYSVKKIKSARFQVMAPGAVVGGTLKGKLLNPPL